MIELWIFDSSLFLNAIFKFRMFIHLKLEVTGVSIIIKKEGKVTEVT